MVTWADVERRLLMEEKEALMEQPIKSEAAAAAAAAEGGGVAGSGGEGKVDREDKEDKDSGRLQVVMERLEAIDANRAQVSVSGYYLLDMCMPNIGGCRVVCKVVCRVVCNAV